MFAHYCKGRDEGGDLDSSSRRGLKEGGGACRVTVSDPVLLVVFNLSSKTPPPDAGSGTMSRPFGGSYALLSS